MNTPFSRVATTGARDMIESLCFGGEGWASGVAACFSHRDGGGEEAEGSGDG